MTEDEGQHVRSQLIRLIDMLPIKTDSQGPQFNRSGLDQGVFKITCADQHTLNWLKELVLRIEPIGDCTFQLVELAELTRLNKVKVWIPGVPSDPKLILTRLSKQNCGLVTSEWRILHRQEKPEGQLLVLGVDDASLRVLRYTGGKAHLEFSRVTFELHCKPTCSDMMLARYSIFGSYLMDITELQQVQPHTLLRFAKASKRFI